MNNDFQINEVLIFQNAEHELFRNETECVLIGGWELRQIGEIDHVEKRIKTVHKECYQVEFADSEVRNVQPHQLRRKKPPQTTKEDSLPLQGADLLTV